MYASRTVCTRCTASRLRLAVTPIHRNGTVAWFSSPATEDEAALDRDTTLSRKTHARRTTQPASLGRPARKKLDQTSTVALFNDVVQRSGASASHSAASSLGGSADVPSASDYSQEFPAFTLGEMEVAAKMKKISEMSLEPLEKLRYFEKNVWVQVKEFRCRMPKHMYLSVSAFLVDMCHAMAEQGITGNSLTLSRMLGTIGKWDLSPRNELVLNLCHVLITAKSSSSQRRVIMEELLKMWMHVSQLMRQSQTQQPGEEAVCQFVLPAVDEIIDDIVRASSPDTEGKQESVLYSPTTRALASIFIQFRLEQAGELVPGLLATVAVLSDARLTRDGSRVQVQAAPLLNLISIALQHQPAEGSYILDTFSTGIRYPPAKLATIKSYVTGQWPDMTKLLFSKDASWRYDRSALSRPRSSVFGLQGMLGRFSRQVRAAYESRVTGAVISVWEDLKAQLVKYPDLGHLLREDPDFLDYWVFVWCARKRPFLLQETLELMQQLQVQPTIRTYTNMMHGWKIRKDWQRIEALWDKLVESGIKLDAVIWTGRISGLIDAGKPQAGIHALAEMQHLWNEAVASTGDVETAASVAIRPTIEVVNAALKGLLTIDGHAANDLLTWAGSEGIEPNVRTFNILIQMSFRSGSEKTAEGVESLLKAMQARGLEPDGATFTIILEEILGSMEGSTAEEQVQAVDQILADLRAAGLEPTRETYGKMLYAVSSLPFGGSEAAISAVQEHMRADGFSSSPHTATILLERALARDPLPPYTGDLIRSLLRKHRLSSIDQGDQTLWERVMSGYAIIGDTTAAMDLFGQLARAGRTVTSLPCLTDLLRALLQQIFDAGVSKPSGAAALANAKQVVRAVINYKVNSAAVEGHTDPDREARYWKHHFWFLAMENSLIDWSTVPPHLERMLKVSSMHM
ncbi:hypothetical protein E4U42_002868 [Claviceps africana]|uniref:Uncharacterized protein n=1 Tax=Claviceps africana TaxID=83212 RepID=A0A8K0NKX9_9HYPO|nr:hypothetical protein E4U42_002868 [Claviceps africana]